MKKKFAELNIIFYWHFVSNGSIEYPWLSENIRKKIDYLQFFIFFRNADKKLQIEGEVSGKVFHFDENSHVSRANEKICSEDAELSPGELRRIESC